MSIYFPEAPTVQGNTKVMFCTAIADPSAPKIATEVKAATSVEGTMAIRAWNPTVNVNTGNAPARLGTKVQQPVEGNVQQQAIALGYPYDPSKPDSDANNKLKALLAEGSTVWAVVRKGVDKDTDWTVADQVEVYKVTCGYQDEGQSGDDEFAEYEVHQNLMPTSPKTIGTLAA